MSAGLWNWRACSYCPSTNGQKGGGESRSAAGVGRDFQSFASHHHPCIPPSLRRLVVMHAELAGFSVSRHFFRSPHAASVQALQFGFMLARTPCTCTTALLFLTAVRWRPMGKGGANGICSARGSSRKWQHPWHVCWGSFGSLKGRPKGNACLIVFAGVRVACKSAPGLV